MVHVCCCCCEKNLMKVEPLLRRRRYNSNMRAEISPAEMLAVTLRYLATGNSQVGELSRYIIICLDNAVSISNRCY